MYTIHVAKQQNDAQTYIKTIYPNDTAKSVSVAM